MSSPLASDDASDASAAEQRKRVRRAERAIELVREAFAELGAAEAPGVAERLAALEQELDQHRPPEPRKCKEYLRAQARAKKGIIGIDPELVVFYCRCFECATIRAKNKLEQPHNRPLSPLVTDEAVLAGELTDSGARDEDEEEAAPTPSDA
jgi:hypothetical protein